jgi:hypothetical protein
VSLLSRDCSNLSRLPVGINTLGLSAAGRNSPVPPLMQGAVPASLALPDPLHRAPARARTEPLGRRSPLCDEPLVAPGPIVTVVEKRSGVITLAASGSAAAGVAGLRCGRARGTAGSARCVSLCPLPSPGTSAGPSSATTFALPAGTHGCNSVVAVATGETAARIPSTSIGAFAAGVLARFRPPARSGRPGWRVQSSGGPMGGEGSHKLLLRRGIHSSPRR